MLRSELRRDGQALTAILAELHGSAVSYARRARAGHSAPPTARRGPGRTQTLGRARRPPWQRPGRRHKLFSVANRTKRTPKKRQVILEAIASGQTVAEAARAAGMARNTIAEWRAADPDFARAFEDSYAAGTDCYEAEARRRAFTESDALLIFLLKSRDPQRFARKLAAVGGDVDNQLVVHSTDAIGSNIHFFLPHNFRDQPERDEDADAPPTIEGEVTKDTKDEAA